LNRKKRIFREPKTPGRGGVFLIDQAVVDESVLGAQFCCDVASCRGACCCLEGLRGAPLSDPEVVEVERALPAVSKYLSSTSISLIESFGPVEGFPGDYATRCVGSRECVFVWFDGPVARCSFERAYLEGLTRWRKPLSCHLFPIRVRSVGQEFLRYEEIPECQAGRESGQARGMRLYEFLEEPLIRKYGRPWYQKLAEHCNGR